MSSNADFANLCAVLYKPLEPIFYPRQNKYFKVPIEWVDEKLRNKYEEILNFAMTKNDMDDAEVIDIPLIDENFEDLDYIKSLGKNQSFSVFHNVHIDIAGKLISIFMDASDPKYLLNLACYFHDKINPYLFNYCLSITIKHRTDTKEAKIPNLLQAFPEKFFDGIILDEAREQLVLPPDFREPIKIPLNYTASNHVDEHRVAYFREDCAINLHHWHWHIIYPTSGPLSVVDKDRRGELFYYMHEQVIARYNFERFCNNLKRVERYLDWHLPIKEAYFPKMTNLVSSRTCPSRVSNMVLKNFERGGGKVDIAELMRWKDRIHKAIDQGFVETASGLQIPLNNERSIDILGNMVEATILSLYLRYYGNIHNMGHNLISTIHDPKNYYLEAPGVMADTATAMRDPIFYRWHGFIDDIFQAHKLTLPAYSVPNLTFAGIIIENVLIMNDSGQRNLFNTFWQKSVLNIIGGLDFQKIDDNDNTQYDKLLVSITHLQHECFSYEIIINNSNIQRDGTVRIFLAPKYNENGNIWPLPQQRLMFIELDRFRVTLRQGRNTITRKSTETPVTIPFEQTFDDYGDEDIGYCVCGWPDHMLIPKGTPEGFECVLFVMISNYLDDVVENSSSVYADQCVKEAYSYCGASGSNYPDRRPMGFPFDRVIRVNSLQNFRLANMFITDCRIVHEDKIKTTDCK